MSALERDTSVSTNVSTNVLLFHKGCVIQVGDTTQDRIGSGGYGVIYRATVMNTDGNLLPQKFLLKTNKDSTVPNLLERETAFAQRVERISVERGLPLGIPRALAYIEDERGIPYILMEEAPGETLKTAFKRLKDTGISPASKIAIAAHITGRLLETVTILETEELVVGEIGKESRTQGVLIHADITSKNVLVDLDSDSPTYGKVTLLDFGVTFGQREIDHKPSSALGTPIWMSPEQSQGVKNDPRTNIFQVGLMLCEALTHQYADYREIRHNFNNFAIMAATADGSYISIVQELLARHKDTVPQEIEAVIMKAIAFNPEDRYQTAEEMRSALRSAMRKIAVRGLLRR